MSDERASLVVLPGTDGTGQLLDDFAEAARGDFRVRAMSYPLDRALGYDELADLLEGSLPQEPFVMLGESFGGPLALMLAARRPAGLRALVLCASFARYPVPLARIASLAAWLPVRQTPTRVMSTLAFGRWDDARHRERLARAVAAVDADTLRRRLAAAARVDATAALERSAVPVLYLQATADRIVPPAAAKHVSRHAPAGFALKRIAGPHFLLQVAPDACAGAIARFVASLRAQ